MLRPSRQAVTLASLAQGQIRIRIGCRFRSGAAPAPAERKAVPLRSTSISKTEMRLGSTILEFHATVLEKRHQLLSPEIGQHRAVPVQRRRLALS